LKETCKNGVKVVKSTNEAGKLRTKNLSTTMWKHTRSRKKPKTPRRSELERHFRETTGLTGQLEFENKETKWDTTIQDKQKSYALEKGQQNPKEREKQTRRET